MIALGYDSAIDTFQRYFRITPNSAYGGSPIAPVTSNLDTN
jgi:hypothetical protein